MAGETGGERRRGEDGRPTGESWNPAKSLRVANEERKIVDFGVLFYRDTNFSCGEDNKSDGRYIKWWENDKRKKIKFNDHQAGRDWTDQ